MGNRKKYTANAHLEYSQRNPGIQSPRQLHGVHRSDQVVLGEVLMGMMRIMLLHARLALGDVVSARCCTSATGAANQWSDGSNLQRQRERGARPRSPDRDDFHYHGCVSDHDLLAERVRPLVPGLRLPALRPPEQRLPDVETQRTSCSDSARLCDLIKDKELIAQGNKA